MFLHPQESIKPGTTLAWGERSVRQRNTHLATLIMGVCLQAKYTVKLLLLLWYLFALFYLCLLHYLNLISFHFGFYTVVYREIVSSGRKILQLSLTSFFTTLYVKTFSLNSVLTKETFVHYGMCSLILIKTVKLIGIDSITSSTPRLYTARLNFKNRA